MGSHVCPWWLAYTFDHPLRRVIQNPERILGPYVKPGMRVLDVGCGMGFFSIGLARLVGDEGLVLSVDLQRKILAVLRKRADKAGVGHRIRTHQCTSRAIGVDDQVDFALAFAMLHEVSDVRRMLEQVRSCLVPDGKFLVAEPRLHVSAGAFCATLDTARDVGLKLCEEPHIRASRAALFVRG